MVKVQFNNGKYSLIEEDGTELEGITIIKDGEREVLKLPENSSNRQYVDKKTVDEKGEVTLQYKEKRTLGARSASAPRAKVYDYLTDEEKKTIEDIMAKAKERYDKAKNDPKEALKAKIAALQKKLEELGL